MSTKRAPKGKGTRNQGAARSNRTPVAEPIADEVPSAEVLVDEPVPADPEVQAEDAGTQADTPRPKRKDQTIEDLQAEYLVVTGHATTSTNRRYLLWRLSAGGRRRSEAHAGTRRAARPKEEMQVLPLGMARDTVARLDAAVKALGFKSRMAFIREALVAKLVFEGSLPDADPAIAEAAEVLKAEAAA